MTLSATRGFTRSILIANRGLRHETVGPFGADSLLDDDLAGAGAGARTRVERSVEARQRGAAVGVAAARLPLAIARARLAGARRRPRGDHALVAGAAVGGRGAHRALRLARRGRPAFSRCAERRAALTVGDAVRPVRSAATRVAR